MRGTGEEEGQKRDKASSRQQLSHVYQTQFFAKPSSSTLPPSLPPALLVFFPIYLSLLAVSAAFFFIVSSHPLFFSLLAFFRSFFVIGSLFSQCSPFCCSCWYYVFFPHPPPRPLQPSITAFTCCSFAYPTPASWSYECSLGSPPPAHHPQCTPPPSPTTAPTASESPPSSP